MENAPAGYEPEVLLAERELEAARLPITEIAGFLRQHLGGTMTAYISGVNDPKMVTRWIAGRSTPRPQPQSRLRESYQAARLLVSAYGDETARAWFNGSNARLDDQGSGLRASQGQELGGAAADRSGCPRVCG